MFSITEQFEYYFEVFQVKHILFRSNWLGVALKTTMAALLGHLFLHHVEYDSEIYLWKENIYLTDKS